MKGNDMPPRLARRDFVRSCVGLMALGLQRRVRAGELDSGKTYDPTHLVDTRSKPFRVSDLPAGETFVFHYPFVSTPCFLINLGQEVKGGQSLRTDAGAEYVWPGGVGPGSSIVAFSAICAHKLTHPAKSVSFINYRPEKITYTNNQDEPTEGRHLIYCCSERSVYDVRDGARVVGGPAKQPLAAIGLEYDEQSDSLFATGTFGGEMFDQYFSKFANRLQLEYKVTDIKATVGAQTLVQHITEFSESQVLC